jgi:hypothetical protein
MKLIVSHDAFYAHLLICWTLIIGMVGTTTAEEPDRACVRCVPRKWLKISTFEPRKVWDDAGNHSRHTTPYSPSPSSLMAYVE